MRQQLLEDALLEIVEAWTSKPKLLETNELWLKVEDSLNLPSYTIPRHKLHSLSNQVWREENVNASKERQERNT